MSLKMLNGNLQSKHDLNWIIYKNIKTNNMQEIYQELQLIEEFEANFNPTEESKARKEYLLS